MPIADLYWLRPYWLLSLLPLLIILVLLWRYRQQQSPWQKLIAPHLQKHLLGKGAVSLSPWSLPLLALCWLLAAIALAGPSWQRIEQPAITVNKATVLIIDMSMSMYATDMVPNRLNQARFKALDFIEALQEGELALVAFAGEAFVVSPLTPDHNNVRLLLPNLRPDIMPSQGSNLLAALKEADRLLQQAGYPQGDIVALVDGFERHSERELFDQVSRMRHRLSIISFGSEEAAPVQLPDGSLLRDSNNQLVLPGVPISQLRQLAQRGGGVFAQARLTDSDIQAVLNQPERQQGRSEQQLQTTGDAWRDKAVYLVWLLLPLALWLGKRGQLLLVCLLLLPPGVMAENNRSLFQTDQQRAMQAYRQGDYPRAAQLFSDPYWRGQAAYRAGDYLAAEQAWAALSDTNPAASHSYNLGNALARQGRFEEALNAYQAALQQDPTLEQARHNAALIQRLLDEQQEQQQDGDDNGQSDDQQEESPQGSDSSQSQDDSAGSSDPAAADAGAESPEQSDSSEAADGSEQTEDTDQQDSGEEQQSEPQQAADTDQTAAEQQQRQVVESPWPDADPEQQQELNNLLRKVQDDPALLLRNRMHIEHQRRRQQQLPTGAREEW
ncbi:VWA domain-containing protein [Alkalimonas amylolytica]|uniref:Ca-activated chloride channel family protein n=1 Tax=Alkalimonas amylolytica TaxID=152573 RepID=A0A1H4CA35_ALKAM|nr:VWA domain-containing protein [Alkalimonas amylolytica]SEA57203.1 Ca-activated chloride channel family protein [Alkalimonas amylolytica]